MDAQTYERLYPGTGVSEAQKEERMERLAVKAGKRSISITVPRLPVDEEGRLKP